MKLLQSASKIVFMLMALTVSIAFLWEVFTGKVTLDAKDFMALVLVAFTYYFTNKGTPTEPYLGK
jgi:hypothetical protein